MSVNLTKNQKVNLSKSAPNLKEVCAGLGWDANKFALFNIDCDAYAYLRDSSGKITETVYFGHLKGANGAVQHMGDNLTGEGEGDDEQIVIHLDQLPENCKSVVIAVNIFFAKIKFQDFGKIKNAYIRIVNSNSRSEICRFDISGNPEFKGKDSMIFGKLVKDENQTWEFIAIGLPYASQSMMEADISQNI